MTEKEYKIIQTATDVTITLIMSRAAREDRDLTENEMKDCKRLYNKLQMSHIQRAKTVAEENSKDIHFKTTVHGRKARSAMRLRRR